jgi:hypothetical protein
MIGDEPRLGGQSDRTGSEPSLSRRYTRNLDDVIRQAHDKLRGWQSAGWMIADLYWRMHPRDMEWLQSSVGERWMIFSTGFMANPHFVGQPILADERVEIGTIWLNATSNKFFVDRLLLDQQD